MMCESEDMLKTEDFYFFSTEDSLMYDRAGQSEGLDSSQGEVFEFVKFREMFLQTSYILSPS